jgi:hypothetical protein
MDFIKDLIKKQPIYYTQAKDMLLWNYLQYLETNDLRYFSNFHNAKTKEPRIDILENSMTAIYGEILEITKRFEVLEKFRKTHKILKLKIKYNCVFDLLKSIYDFDVKLGKELLDEKIVMLEKWNYKISKDKELFEQIDKIAKGLAGLKTEIEVLETELLAENKSEKQSFEKERLAVEMGLELKIAIDPMKDSVERWFILLVELEKKVEYLNKKNNGKSN